MLNGFFVGFMTAPVFHAMEHQSVTVRLLAGLGQTFATTPRRLLGIPCWNCKSRRSNNNVALGAPHASQTTSLPEHACDKQKNNGKLNGFRLDGERLAEPVEPKSTQKRRRKP